MKFYIFGNTTKETEICCSVKKAAFISDDLETSINRFRDYVHEVRFTNCYLVVDFEVSKKNTSSINASTLENNYDKTLPFFIIAEWHIGEDKNLLARVDHTILTKNGFIHEFMNNVDVIRDVIYCLNNHIQFTLEITYSVPTTILGYKEIQEFRRLIVDSVDIIRDEGYSVKKFKLNISNWQVVPINRIFNLYKIEEKVDPEYDEFVNQFQVIGQAR